MNFDNYYVYDLETYPNCFTAVFANESQKKMWVFEISDRKDDSVRFRKFLTKLYKEQASLVGFNNCGFDSVILHRWLADKTMNVDDIYQLAQEIIEAMNDEERKFEYQVHKDKEWLRQVDLYLINHFNNQARRTSLKMLEFNMRSQNIEDLPFAVGTILTSEEMDTLIKYNKHDVLETLKFFNHCKDAITFRAALSSKIGVDMTNFDDSKIGSQFFISELDKVNPELCYQKQGNRKVARKTHRKKIDFKDVVFDYIKFKRPEFQAVQDWLLRQVITETKGVFSDIEEHDLGELAKYANMTTKSKKITTKPVVTDKEEKKALRKELREGVSEQRKIEIEDLLYGKPSQEEIGGMLKARPCSNIVRKELSNKHIAYYWEWRIAETLNVVVDGFQYDFGTGGIHGSHAATNYQSDENISIRSWDVASYYPNLAIKNNLYPEHLGKDFCRIYEDLYNRRKSFAKGTPENAVLKLSLNGTYGNSNNKYSPFYDPLFTMRITVNGQLLLCKLAEMLLEVKSVEIIMINTDGLEFICHPNDVQTTDEICHKWEKMTKLTLEGEGYETLAIANVNNYVGVFENGKVKRKGSYEYDRNELGWHQNHSALIIKEAAVREILEHIPVEETIRACKDPFDFMLRTKVPRSSRLELRYFDDNGNVIQNTTEQNITRYYVASNGGKLIKVMPPLAEGKPEREIGIDASWLVKTCNNMKQFDWDINYDYYISEAKKLVNATKRED